MKGFGSLCFKDLGYSEMNASGKGNNIPAVGGFEAVSWVGSTHLSNTS
jgi:hypothetical protein